MPSESKPHDHGSGSQDKKDCPMCMVHPSRPGSAKVAWTIAVIAVLLLVGVFFYGASSRPGTLFAGGGFVLLAILACPLVMGGMMLMMGRGHH